MSIPRSAVKRVAGLWNRLAADHRAATAVEYGLIAALIVIASIVAIDQLASQTSGMWNNVHDKVVAAH